MTTPTPPQSTKKARRDSIGGKRGDGHRRYQRIRRPDPRNSHIGAPDAGLTAFGGLAGFGAFIRELGVDESLRYRFGHLKSSPGYNPRYQGRPSYHPILARCAETDTVAGAKLRPGDTSFGEADAPTVGAWIDRLRDAAGPQTLIRVRIDAAGDCTKVMLN